MTLPERMVEAAARAYREAVDSLNGATDERIAEAVIRRALAVAEAEGAGVFVVPTAEPDESRTDALARWRDGHNACRATTLAGRVTL